MKITLTYLDGGAELELNPEADAYSLLPGWLVVQNSDDTTSLYPTEHLETVFIEGHRA